MGVETHRASNDQIGVRCVGAGDGKAIGRSVKIIIAIEKGEIAGATFQHTAIARRADAPVAGCNEHRACFVCLHPAAGDGLAVVRAAIVD